MHGGRRSAVEATLAAPVRRPFYQVQRVCRPRRSQLVVRPRLQPDLTKEKKRPSCVKNHRGTDTDTVAVTVTDTAAASQRRMGGEKRCLVDGEEARGVLEQLLSRKEGGRDVREHLPYALSDLRSRVPDGQSNDLRSPASECCRKLRARRWRSLSL